jgi:hypothetical protein
MHVAAQNEIASALNNFFFFIWFSKIHFFLYSFINYMSKLETINFGEISKLLIC